MSCASATTSARTGAASGRSSFGWFCPISGGSVRFRVVLSDDAAKHRLRQAATSVMGRLAERLNFPALGVFPYHNFRSRVAGRSVGLSGVCGRLAKRPRHLAGRRGRNPKQSSLRRAVSTAYYAAFHLLVADFIANWKIPEQRARLGRMFEHRRMSGAPQGLRINTSPPR